MINIIDLANPISPNFIGIIDTLGNVSNMVINKDVKLAYLADNL